MKKRMKLIIGLLVACAGTLILGACAGDGNPYGGLNDEGYSVSVRYDINGGMFSSIEGVNVVDVFRPEDIGEGIKLIAPDSDLRGDNRHTISRSGYVFAGWYRTRELRTEEGGAAVDEDGNLCSESGKEQGYVYSGRWDFDRDLFSVTEEETDYVRGEYTMTLYAAWVPTFAYRIYIENEEQEWELLGSYMFNPATQSKELELPHWIEGSAGTGAMVYGDFPQAEGKTFTAAYWDEEKQEECEGLVEHPGIIDYDRGISQDGVLDLYTEWQNGIWFHIYTADQFLDNARIDGYYQIFENLDFTGKTWSNGLSIGNFSGAIYGNGHVFSNISVVQADNSRVYGGLFGRIMPDAVFENVTFENVVYKLAAGSRQQGASFGLFTGSLASEVQLSGVSVTGTFVFGGGIYPLKKPAGVDYDGYSIGLFSGNGATNGAQYEIDAEIADDMSGTSYYYPCNVSIDRTTGTVTLTANPDTAVKPEIEYVD